MTDLQRNYLIAGIIAIVVIIAGIYLMHGGSPNSQSGLASTTATGTTIDLTESGAINGTSSPDTIVGPNGAYTIHLLSDGSKPVTPDLTKALVFDSAVDANAKAALNSQFATVKARLAKSPNDFNALVDLAMIRKVAGDTTGAVEIWTYASQLYFDNKVTFVNLGNYYFGTKAYSKAEADYLQAEVNDPANIDVYKDLFQMYSTVYKTTTTAAEDVLKKGITNNPKAFDLRVLLARYYKAKGRTADAQAQYQAAISVATAQGNTTAAAQLQTESAQ